MSLSSELLRKQPYIPGLLAQTQVAVLQQPGQFLLRKEPLLPCAPNEVTISLEGCGLCASSLPVWEGRPWLEYPLDSGVPGHESWGKVVALGSEVRRLRTDLFVGQRVTTLGGQAFARHINVPATEVVALPQSLAGIPFPGDAIARAMNIFRRAEILPGQTVAIIGAGFLGLLLVQLAVSVEARVLVMSRRTSSLALAQNYGADACFDTHDSWGNARKMLEFTGGRGCERVIETTGMQFALEAATEIVGENGRLVIAGHHQEGTRQIDLPKWTLPGIEVSSAQVRNPQQMMQGIREGIFATEAGFIRPQELLTHRFSLEQLNQAFQTLADRPEGFVKAWVAL
jgi:threonine dehydrogenase-like Zn-dependent dehydrogenase